MRKSLLLLFLLISTLTEAQFEKYYDASGHVYHDLNIEVMKSAPFDLIIAGNYFDPQMQNYVPFIKRIDANGNVVWNNTGVAVNLSNLRIFDIETYQDLLFITGTVVDAAGHTKSFAARLDLLTGNLSDINYYDIVASSFDNEAYHIKYTEADFDHDGAPNPGFVISGYFTISNNEKDGFMLRTDFQLQPLFTTEISAMTTQSPKNTMVSKVIETPDGYFAFGLTTYFDSSNVMHQGVLARKFNIVDFTPIWDSSYFWGNNDQVAVDAYYDSGTNKIYMLVNYAENHMFGITVYDNATGNILSSQSWYATDQNDGKYGFKINRSLTNAHNLVISGYDRLSNIATTTPVWAESNVIVYEFDTLTGQISGQAYQYAIPNQELGTDPYNFWDNQMPLIYYPEMSQNYLLNTGLSINYKLGYFEDPVTNVPDLAVFKVYGDNQNTCNNFTLNYTPNPLTNYASVSVSSGNGITTTSHSFNITTNPQSVVVTDCASLRIDDTKEEDGMLYPNPVKNKLFVKFKNFHNFIIRDASQRMVKKGVVRNNFINTNSLKKGIYFIEIKSENGQVKRKMFIKK